MFRHQLGRIFEKIAKCLVNVRKKYFQLLKQTSSCYSLDQWSFHTQRGKQKNLRCKRRKICDKKRRILQQLIKPLTLVYFQQEKWKPVQNNAAIARNEIIESIANTLFCFII